MNKQNKIYENHLFPSKKKTKIFRKFSFLFLANNFLPKLNKKQGGIDAKLGLTVWLPLNGDSNTNVDNIKPDYTINNLQELLTILPENNGNPKKPNFRTRTNARRVPYNRRVASLPDLPDFESGNSNSSDGS